MLVSVLPIFGRIQVLALGYGKYRRGICLINPTVFSPSPVLSIDYACARCFLPDAP